MANKIAAIFLKLSRASVITAVSSGCAILELSVFSSRLEIRALGIVLAAQAMAALVAAIGEGGISLWIPQRLATAPTPRRLTAMARYAIGVRALLFPLQAVLTALAARYTLVGWEHFGVALLLSASMSFSFGWVLIASERYVLIAAVDGITRVAGLATFLLIGSNSANTALMCLAVSGVAQSVIQLIAARGLGLLDGIPLPRLLRKPRPHKGHLAAYQSNMVQALGRNVLPVTVGAVVSASLASTALAAEKVSRAATGVVTAGLGYIMPMLGRSYKASTPAAIYSVTAAIGLVVFASTTLALFAYSNVSQASLAQLFATNHLLLVAAATLTATKVMFSATIYVRLLARGAYKLTARLLGWQAVVAAGMALALRWTESVELFMFCMCLFDLVLIAVAAQSERQGPLGAPNRP